MENLTTDDLLGRFHFKCFDARPIEGYYTCLNFLKPLLELESFTSSITGFYLNISANPLAQVRLSYFTNKSSINNEIVKFIEESDDLVLIKSVKPRVNKISRKYGCEELRFRKYLHTYTQIGLDLLNYNRLYARILAAEYRLTYSPQKEPSRPLFEPAFTKHSTFFKQLNPTTKDQVWRDLDYWHPIDKPSYIADWAHMLVNMLLPGDWIYQNQYYMDLFLKEKPRPPLDKETKKKMLIGLNLKIPDDWNP